MESHNGESDLISQIIARSHIGYDQQYQSIWNICIIQEHI